MTLSISKPYSGDDRMINESGTDIWMTTGRSSCEVAAYIFTTFSASSYYETTNYTSM
jgi:hypothetical protein